MNIQLAIVLSDVSGMTGQAIIQRIGKTKFVCSEVMRASGRLSQATTVSG